MCIHNTLFIFVRKFSVAGYLLATSLYCVSQWTSSLAVLTYIGNCYVRLYEVVPRR